MRPKRPAERQRLQKLERENRELRKANEILKAASRLFAKYLDETRGAERLHRGPEGRRLAVELICRTPGVSRSAYYQRASGHQSARAISDTQLIELPRRVRWRDSGRALESPW